MDGLFKDPEVETEIPEVTLTLSDGSLLNVCRDFVAERDSNPLLV